MLEFREINIEDKKSADEILSKLNYRLCENCFGDLFIWRNIFNTRIAFENGFLFVKFKSKGENYYLFPAGTGKIDEAVKLIYKDAQNSQEKFRLACVTPEMKEKLESAFPEKFEYEPSRASFDYIYNSSDLITLAGRKFHSKRNHAARFERLGDWHYEEITKENIGDCKKMNDEWCKVNGCGMDDGLKDEHCAVLQAFKHYSELGLSGGLLRLDGRVVAFSIGQKLCSDTLIVHIEKAFSDVEGAYTVINREFAAHNAAGFAYVNREDDTGSEGLRKAKLSYHPAILLEKNYAFLKPDAAL